MTSKERAQLKAQANSLPILFQVGKGGVSETLLAQTRDAFRSRELIKLKALLESIPESPEVLAEQIAQDCGAEVVQVIGGSMIFYKENPELREKARQKKKSVAKKPGVGIRARKAKKAREQRAAPKQGAPQRGSPQRGKPQQNPSGTSPRKAADRRTAQHGAPRGARPQRTASAMGKKPGEKRNPKQKRQVDR